jgi:ABC-type transport system involved in multi-copper enzyme maturation permease subunit
MRDALGPYRAALTLGRRRSLILLLVVMVSLFGQRAFLAKLQHGTLTQESLFQFGIGCFGGGPIEKPGFEPQAGTSETPETPPAGPETPAPTEQQNLPTCQFVGPDGPIGPTFQGEPFGPNGPTFTQDFIDQLRPELIKSQRQIIAQTQQLMGSRFMFSSRVRGLGTFVGIVFAVLFGATFIGADFRWGVWRTLLTHEPRRGRVLTSKLSAMWTYVLLGFVVTLAVMTGVDVVMRSISNVHASGGPTVARLAKESGWALLSVEMYATMAAALALAVRTSIAGIATLLLTVGDHLLISKYHWLRHFFPVQQVAALLPTPERLATAYVWFPRVTGGYRCTEPPGGQPGFSECKEILLKPIPHWRASVVLAGWLVAFTLAAWAVLRARDVPQ